MKKIIFLFLCLSCGSDVPDRTILAKFSTDNPYVCKFIYKHNIFHGAITFEDSCRFYKVGDKIKF